MADAISWKGHQGCGPAFCRFRNGFLPHCLELRVCPLKRLSSRNSWLLWRSKASQCDAGHLVTITKNPVVGSMFCLSSIEKLHTIELISHPPVPGSASASTPRSPTSQSHMPIPAWVRLIGATVPQALCQESTAFMYTLYPKIVCSHEYIIPH